MADWPPSQKKRRRKSADANAEQSVLDPEMLAQHEKMKLRLAAAAARQRYIVDNRPPISPAKALTAEDWVKSMIGPSGFSQRSATKLIYHMRCANDPFYRDDNPFESFTTD